jgi:hypothetical protein
LDYDVVEELKKMKANIIVFELCKITQLWNHYVNLYNIFKGPQDVSVGNEKVTLKGNNAKVTKLTRAPSVTNASSIDNKDKTTCDQKKGDPRVDGALIEKKSRS